MTKEELVSKINDEINNLEELKKADNSLLEFFSNFTNKYKGIVAIDFDTIDLYDLAICLFLSKRNEFTLEQAREVLLPVKQLIKISNPNDINLMCESILKIIRLNETDLLTAFISNFSISNPKEIITNTLNNNKVLEFLENDFLEVQNTIHDYDLDRSMIVKLVDLLKKYGFEIWDVKRIIGNIKLVCDFEILIKYPKITEDIVYQERITKKIQKHIQYVYDQLNTLFKYNEKLKRKESSRLAKIDKKEQPLKEFINTLETTTNTEITNFQEMIEKLPEYLRLDALKLIYMHNEKIYSDIDIKHKELSNNKKIKYQSLLNSYNINYLSSSLLRISYEDLNKSLQLLKKFNLDNNTIIYILENSSLSIIEEINLYLERNIINKKLIKNNYLILLPSIEHSNLTNNIKVLEKENINPNSFIASAKILLIDNTLFSTNIEVLKKYNLLNSMKSTSNYNFLKEKDLINIIDKLLELGMEKFLEENLGLLNNKKLDRLYILKALNIKINTNDELKSYLSLKNFYVDDENIFKYIHNGIIPISDDEGTVDLDKFSSTSRTININGVIFSKNKVKRNLNTNSLEDTKKALFKDIILTDEEIDTVCDALDDKKVYTYK